MTPVNSLRALQKFIESEVASTMLLRKEGLTTQEPEFVNPYVALITLPHKNFVPVNFQVPHILVGLINGTDDANEHSLNVRLQFATFGGDTVFNESANIPDSGGYIDLLNLIERTKSKLVNAGVIEDAGLIEKPMHYGVYDEQITYPYWYGHLTFNLQIPVSQRQMTEFDYKNLV